MINKLIKLRGGIICKIVDSIIQNGNTLYLVIDITNKLVTTINPKDILYFVNINENGEYVSSLDKIIRDGL